MSRDVPADQGQDPEGAHAGRPWAPSRPTPPDRPERYPVTAPPRPPASFVSRLIDAATARALDREYLNGVLAAFHYLRSPAGEKEALELLRRRREDR